MGKYLNENSKGEPLPACGKASSLIADGATIIPIPILWEESIVCVVENGLFDAACYCDNLHEIGAYQYSDDTRRKIWLKYKHAKELGR